MALTWVRTYDWDVNKWRNNSACRDADPEIFFPVGSTGMALDQIEIAKRICAECEVAKECLEFALETNQEAGVWGNTTEEERRKYRKTWVPQQAAAVAQAAG